MLADGVQSSALTVTLRDAWAEVLVGWPAELAASGGGDLLIQPSGPTGPDGVASDSLATTSAGQITVSARVTGLPGTLLLDLTQADELTFVPLPVLAVYVQPSDAVAGLPISPALEVAFADGAGQPVSSMNGTIALAVASGPAGPPSAGRRARIR